MPPKSKLDKDLILGLYVAGFSTTEIAELVGDCTYGAICWIVRPVARDRGEAISASKPPKSFKSGASRTRARGIMRRHLKRSFAHNEHVHHKNGDWTDNRLENLELLPASVHLRLHKLGKKVVRKAKRL